MEGYRTELAPGYSIARLIQGCWQLADGHRLSPAPGAASNDQATLIDLLASRALAGRTTFDCADIYTGVEELLGRVRLRVLELGGDEPQIHTKCVPDLDRLATLQRADLERTIDRSLRRLGVERLDLVQFHWWDLEIPGFEQAACWLDEMRLAGKIRCLGATNFSTEGLRQVLDAGVPVVSHQVQYSLLDRRPAAGMAELCIDRGVTLLCYGALAGGLLSSRFLRSGLADEPRNRSEVKYRLMVDEAGGWDVVSRVLAQLDGVEGSDGERVAPAAVRWVLEQPAVGAAIVGASRARDLTLHAVLGMSLERVEAVKSVCLESLRGVPGEVYELERDRAGRHGRVMKYGLQAE